MHILCAGSKEERFFDSQPWLESDCEDYFSVNGGKNKFVAGKKSSFTVFEYLHFTLLPFLDN